MKLLPILTEKSLGEAQKGNYTFLVDRKWNKGKIAEAVTKVFDVKVSKVRTINYKSVTKKNNLGRKRIIPGKKKAMVTLSGKDKIDLFEAKK